MTGLRIVDVAQGLWVCRMPHPDWGPGDGGKQALERPPAFID